MATSSITLPRDSRETPIPVLKPKLSQNLTIGVAADNTTAFPEKSVVRLVATVDCFIKIGPNAVATTNETYLVAGQPEYFSLEALDRVSVIQNTAAGTLNITTMG